MNSYSLEDFQDYYKKHYEGMSRNEVLKGDWNFYNAIRKKFFTAEVFPKKRSGRLGKFSNFSLKDFQDYYKKHCEGMSRSEILKEDLSFYNALRKNGFRDKVFPKIMRKGYKKLLELNVRE